MSRAGFGQGDAPGAPPLGAANGQQQPYQQQAQEHGSTPGQQQQQQPMFDYQRLYDAVKDKPCRVDRISKTWEGDDDSKPLRTRQHLIDRELQRLYDAETFEQVHSACEEVARNLTRLQVFNDVRVLVHEEPLDHPDLVTVLVSLAEKNWYALKAATYVQANETSFELGLGVHNVTGNAEHVTVTAEVGSEKSTQFSLNYEHPKPWDLPITAVAKVCQLVQNNQKASSYLENFRGVSLGFRSYDDKHSVDYELGWRNLADPAGVASKAVLLQLGDYMKSSVKYSYTFGDKKIDADSGQVSGWAAQTTTEVSGLGFDPRLQFAKQQIEWASLVPVTQSITLSFSVAAGLILPYGRNFESTLTNIADRFFLGKPTLRGFGFKSVGALDARRPPARAPGATDAAAADRDGDAAAPKYDALGGDVFACVNAALLFQLPVASAIRNFVQGQLFVNGGSCTQLTGTGRSIASGLQGFSRTLRWSTGAGLVIPTPMGRFEANYVWVLSNQPQDRLKTGFQLGFAASPLL